MLKMLSGSIHFISTNVKGIQSFEKRIKFFEYLEKALFFYRILILFFVGLFFYRRHTPPYMIKKKKRRV